MNRFRYKRNRRNRRNINQNLSLIQKNIFDNKYNIHFISYGDNKYKKSRIRIYNEAKNTNWFYSIKIYNKSDISINFYNEYKDIFIQKKGGGYWLWKLYIILDMLSKINNNDYLIYCDAGCKINKNGEKRFKEYISLLELSEFDIISFQLTHKEYKYTTKEIFNIFNVKKDSEIYLSDQYVGGILIMKKTEKIVNMFIDIIKKIKNDHKIITDYYNNNQIPEFIKNRHDQSLLSVARKVIGSLVIQDETYYKNFNSKEALTKPFLAKRIRK